MGPVAPPHTPFQGLLHLCGLHPASGNCTRPSLCPNALPHLPLASTSSLARLMVKCLFLEEASLISWSDTSPYHSILSPFSSFLGCRTATDGLRKAVSRVPCMLDRELLEERALMV